MFLFVFSILSRRCPLLATFLPVLFCLLSLLISDSRFDLVWFRLSCDHGWIRSGSVNVGKTTNNNNNMVINVSVQCNGGLLPDIILLTLCDSIGETFQYHGEFLSLQSMFPPN